jgi:murein L,D-transpeptidase YcbB/YkuD
MDIAAIIALAIKYGPIIKGILDAAMSNSGIVAAIEAEAKPIAGLLEQIGASLFPKAAPELHVVAGAVAAFDPNTTKWLQGELNALLSPSPDLVIDGIYGPKTTAAVEAFQQANGLKIDGVAGEITKAALDAALAHLPTLK